MKLLSLLFTALLCSVMAQAQYDELGEELLDDDPIFEVNDVDAKFSNESAVVLAQKTKLIVRKTDETHYTEYWVTRMKLKLQDKAAVEYFSDFSISSSDLFEMNIIKPDGQVIEVDTNDAIPVNEGISLSSFFVNMSLNVVDYKKLAIQNLEIGDVIDYAYAENETHYSKPVAASGPVRKYNTWENFLSYSYAFGSTYPKMIQEFVIEIDPTLYFNFKSLNGAPEPTVSTLDNGNKEYTISLKDIPRQESEYFSDVDLTNPRIKLELSYCAPFRYYRNPLLLGQQGVLNGEASSDRLKRAMFLNFAPGKFEALSFLDVYEKDPGDYLRKAFKNFQREVFEEEGSDYVQSSYSYSGYMYEALAAKGFDADIVLCVSKENGNVSEIVRSADFIYGVRVKDGNDYVYSFPIKKYSGFDDWNYGVVGTDAYAFKPSKKFKSFTFTEIEIPEYKPSDNRYEVNMKVSLDVEKGTADIKSETKLSGEIKTLFGEDILITSELEYDRDDLGIDKLERFFERSTEMAEIGRLNMMEGEIAGEFELVKYKSFDIVSTGMEYDNDMLNYKENYVVSDIYRPAGSEYLVLDIGKLITSQIALMPDDRDRQSDIVVQYVKQYEYTINLVVPEGYSIVGYEHLNTNVKTDAGVFNTTAKTSKSGLTVVSFKSYNTTFLPQSSWSEMEAFLDAAYDFSQQKLVLVKDAGSDQTISE